jgi:hypothetical protein
MDTKVKNPKAPKADASAKIATIAYNQDNLKAIVSELCTVKDYKPAIGTREVTAFLIDGLVHKAKNFLCIDRTYKRIVRYDSGKLTFGPGVVKLEYFVVDKDALAAGKDPSATAVNAFIAYVKSLNAKVVCMSRDECAYEHKILKAAGFHPIGKIAWGKDGQFPGIIFGLGIDAPKAKAPIKPKGETVPAAPKQKKGKGGKKGKAS